MYQSAGYFLTRVAIPPQALDDGGAVSVKGEVDVSRIQRREARASRLFVPGFGRKAGTLRAVTDFVPIARETVLGTDPFLSYNRNKNKPRYRQDNETGKR